jgi:hypothetical protein
MKILLIAFFAASVQADTAPVPKMFKGIAGQKGQYQVEMLEGGPGGGGGKAPPAMTICTDNLMKPPADGAKGGAPKGGDSGCTYKLLKDTADEAVVESTCKDRTSTITMKRENAKTMLMSVQSTGPRGPQNMKMRYTHLGACREGQGAVSLDPNGEQCKQMRAQAAQMDAKMREQILAMCR